MVDRLCIESTYLVASLRVANPIGGYATLGMRCDQLELDLLGHKFACSLYVIDFVDFGIILDVDWLSTYEARIFCRDREISLGHPDSHNRVIFSVENTDRSVSALLNAMEVGDV